MKKILLLITLIVGTTFAQATKTPQDIVNTALIALTNGDIEKLLTLTEKTELKQTKELLVLMENKQKRTELINQYKTLQSWSIENTEEQTINGKQFAVVSTIWVTTPTLEANSDKNLPTKLKSKTIYVDYMLEKINNEWKIISRRSA